MCKNARIYILEEYNPNTINTSVVFVFTVFGDAVEIAKELSLNRTGIKFFISEAILNDINSNIRYLADVMNGQMTLL